MRERTETDITHGPVMNKIFTYALPLMFSGVLQLLFSAADMVVVGQFAGGDPFAAIGASGTLVSLIVNAFMGLSVGAGVLAAQSHGGGDETGVHEVVHTAMLTGAIGGMIAAAVGFFGCRTFLVWMNTPVEILDLSVLYVKIYCLGLPAMMIYNFGAAILRAVGDTRHPMYFLTVAGGVNVMLNLFAVAVLRMDVAGVALATIISQIVSAVLTVRFLMHRTDCCRLVLRKIRFYPARIAGILRVGIPSAVQASMFCLSNTVIQSSVNFLGKPVVQGSAAAASLESFAAAAEISFSHAALVFVGQNAGARKYHRIPRIVAVCILFTVLTGMLLGGGICLFRKPLLGFYLADAPEAVGFGEIRIIINILPHFFYGVMEVFASTLRGLGASLLPTVLSLTGSCFARLLWVFTVFAAHPTPETLFLCYPITWVLTIVLEVAAMLRLWYRIRRRAARKAARLEKSAAAV